MASAAPSEMARLMAEAPIFEALAARTKGTTMDLPVYEFPHVRALRGRLRLQERHQKGLVSQPRPRLSDALNAQRFGGMYSMGEHDNDL